jgi:hypothetical protein
VIGHHAGAAIDALDDGLREDSRSRSILLSNEARIRARSKAGAKGLGK